MEQKTILNEMQSMMEVMVIDTLSRNLTDLVEGVEPLIISYKSVSRPTPEQSITIESYEKLMNVINNATAATISEANMQIANEQIIEFITTLSSVILSKPKESSTELEVRIAFILRAVLEGLMLLDEVRFGCVLKGGAQVGE